MNGFPAKRWLRCAACLVALVLSSVVSATPQKARAQEDSVIWMRDVMTKTAGALSWTSPINPPLDGASMTLNMMLSLGGPTAYIIEKVGATTGFMMIIDTSGVTKREEGCNAQEWMSLGEECDISIELDEQYIFSSADSYGTPTFMHEYKALEGDLSDGGLVSREVRWSDGKYVYIVIQSGYVEGDDQDGDGLIDALTPPCDGDRCIGTFGTHKDQSGNPTGCPDRDHDGLVDEPPDAVPSGEGYSCPGLTVDDRVDTPPPGGQGPHWDWAEMLYHYASTTPKDDRTYNLDPEITKFYPNPENPTNTDTVVITVEASDPDGDALSYIWVVDDVRQSANSSQITWVNPPPGPHEVVVTVTDGKGGEVERTLSFHVTEASVPGDRDDDGVSDDEDRCPDEFGLNLDGCPDFAVQLGCDPAVPEEGQAVVCIAESVGAHPGESLRFDWYLDDAPVASDLGQIWVWEEAAAGAHTVDVLLTGEGREARAAFTLGVKAEEDLVVRIGMVPDPPVGGAHVDFVATVEGQLVGERLRYEWYFDEDQVGEHETYVWSEAITGMRHSVTVFVYGEAGRWATDTRGFSVPAAPAGPAAVAATDDAGFEVAQPDCSDDIASDETLACTVRINRERDDVGVLNVVWLIDRATAASESTAGDSARWALDRPPPGEHVVEVQVTDPATGNTLVRTAPVTVRPGANVPVSPGAQLGAAAGTTTAIGAWLWLEWMRQRWAAAAEAALEQDRQRWFDRVGERNRIERERRLRREGFEYEKETDTWKPGDYHPDVVARRIRAEMRKAETHIHRMMEKLPEGRWNKIEDLVEKLTSPTNPNVEDYMRVRRLQGVVFDAVQAQWEKEAALADLDAIRYAEWEMGATRVRLVNEVVGLVVSLALPATPLLAALNLGGNFLEGLGEGYFEAGLTQGLARAAQYTLPVNTAVSIYETMRGDYDQESASWRAARIVLSTVRDIGNAFSLSEGIEGARRLLKGSNVVSRAYRRASDTLEYLSERLRGKSKIDAQWLVDRRRGGQLVDEFGETYAQYRKAASKAERKALLRRLEEQAIQINSSYQAKAILKAQGRSKLARVFDNRIQRVYREVDAQAIEIMNGMGLRRGGRKLTLDDMWDVRNKTSWGTAGMDRDWALNEKYVTKLKERLSAAVPGSEEAQKIARELVEARRASRITLNGNRISLAEWNERAQEAYRRAYRRTTGQDADEAFQALTQSQNAEAYADLRVLENNPIEKPFQRQWSAQTASVTAYKAHHNRHLVSQGSLSEGNAIQETFRGLEKDMRTKLMPMVRGSQRVPFQRQQRLTLMRQLFKRAGDGRIPPDRAVQILEQRFGVTLEGAVDEVTTNLESAILLRGR